MLKKFNKNELLFYILIALRLSYPIKALTINTKLFYLIFYSIVCVLVVNFIRPLLKKENLLDFLLRIIKSKIYIVYLVVFLTIFLLKILFAANFNTDFFSPFPLMVSYINLLIALILGEYVYYNRDNYEFITTTIKVTFYSMLSTIISSIFYLTFIDKYGARRGNAVFKGVADYNFIYIAIFLVLFYLNYENTITNRFKDYSNMWFGKLINNRIVLLSTLSLAVTIFMLKSGFMIALVLYFYTLIIYYFYVFKNYSLKKMIIIHIVTVFSIILLRVPVGYLIGYSARLFQNNWVISNKMMAISNLLTGASGQLDTLGPRAELFNDTLTSIKNNFFFGISFSDYGKGIIGNHTQWFDDYARMGLFSLIFVGFGFNYYKSMITNNTKTVKIIAYVFIVLGFINPNLMSTMTMFLFTLTSPIVTDRKQNNNLAEDTLVSVIIPSYNSKDTIERTVQSVINQSYKNIDIVIVNDGSTDNPEEYLNKISKIDKRIRIVNKVNGGVSSARNAGIVESKGEFVMFLDADDTYNKDFIIKTLDINADISFSGFNIVMDSIEYPQYNQSKYFFEKNKSKLVLNYLSRKIQIHTSNWIIKKDLVITHDIRFLEGLNWAEDILFFTQSLLQSQSISGTDEYLTYHYFDYNENRLSSQVETRFVNESKFTNELVEYLDIVSISNKDKDKIKRMINEYRLPATMVYAILEADKEDLELTEVQKEVINNITLINGLRSLKLKLLVYKNL